MSQDRVKLEVAEGSFELLEPTVRESLWDPEVPEVGTLFREVSARRQLVLIFKLDPAKA